MNMPEPQEEQGNGPQSEEGAPQEGRIIAQRQQWGGPLPPPAALEHFEAIVPGSANRIITMAEREQLHRHSTERVAITADIADGKKGKNLGALISILALVGAVYVAVTGGPWQVSVALVGLPIASIVRDLVGRRKGG